ncbi:hypothetical protein K474DRAFT_1041851 [Panus rudis PR-1116 ss-1]|nr:hypothetical protein K474DRAFT_1041851 [Panus rudis PR-1116 ss-1]
MSAESLPRYSFNPSFSRTPSYSAEPHEYEQRIALNRSQTRPPSGDFVKQSKSAGISLRLTAQDSASLPVYGCGASVDGKVDISKPEGVFGVEVKIEGSLRLKEIAEGGTTTHKLCLTKLSLWSKDRQSGPCPSSVPFSIALPTTFSDGRETYPLPPSHEAHLSGVPGFRATIDYSVTAYVFRGRAAQLLPIKNSNVVSTPFIYYPRSRPAVPLPSPMILTRSFPGVLEVSEWICFDGVMPARSRNVSDITAKLYIPSSRVYCISEPIPFHLSFTGSTQSLASFLPYAPSTSPVSPGRKHTRIQVLRQSTVDVRNETVMGTKTDIWRVVSIGEGTFKHAVDGPTFMSFVGEINIDPSVKVGGFKAGGFSIKDCLVLSMTPPDPTKTPFHELRSVVPIRLTTDSWNSGGAGLFAGSEYSAPSTPDDTPGPDSHFGDYREPPAR